MVPRCRVHGRAFTVYPPGHTPYGRLPLLKIALDGTEIASEVPEPIPAATDGPAAPLTQSPDATRLGDVRRASLGQAGARFADGGSDFWWGTQSRHIAFSLALLGVLPELDSDARFAHSKALEVPLQLLKDGAYCIACAPSYRSRGQAAIAVFDAMNEPNLGHCALDRLRRLLAAGHLAGKWGPPYWWDRSTRQLRRWAFPAAGTRPP